MTAGHYRRKVRSAEQWVADQAIRHMHGPLGGTSRPDYRALDLEPARRFGLDKNWNHVGNPITRGRL